MPHGIDFRATSECGLAAAGTGLFAGSHHGRCSRGGADRRVAGLGAVWPGWAPCGRA